MSNPSTNQDPVKKTKNFKKKTLKKTLFSKNGRFYDSFISMKVCLRESLGNFNLLIRLIKSFVSKIYWMYNRRKKTAVELVILLGYYHVIMIEPQRERKR